jgi:hypothetical protein
LYKHFEMSSKIKLTELKANPNNPRIIKDNKFNQLVKSIKDFPEMMEKRPIVVVTDVDGKMYPLGGNMRLKALQELDYKEIPDNWITRADNWTQEQRNEFIIKDNVSFGEWNWEQLANEWDVEQLEDWGLDVPITIEDINQTKDVPDIGEIEFSEELLLEHNYIVLYFDNAMDWEVAQEFYGLKYVKTNTPLKTQKVGIGRVINGKNFI